MIRLIVVITAFWGLWGLPVLCQSGVLSACCEHMCASGGDEECDRDHEETCSDSENTHSEKADSVCECAACDQMCGAQVTKPSPPPNVRLAELNNVSAAGLAGSVANAAGAGSLNDVPSSARTLWLKLPYPMSDRPLLL